MTGRFDMRRLQKQIKRDEVLPRGRLFKQEGGLEQRSRDKKKEMIEKKKRRGSTLHKRGFPLLRGARVKGERKYL